MRDPCSEYLLRLDPLDGSSNLDVGVWIGTIFFALQIPGSGGRFLDPQDQRAPNKPGKLRSFVGANPMN